MTSSSSIYTKQKTSKPGIKNSPAHLASLEKYSLGGLPGLPGLPVT